MTPRGEVVDLPRGATPLDFAYHVHTDLGHRCRGAKIDGRIVPLNQPLANGDVVEIITGKQPAPSRDWLSPEPGFLVSPKSRAKVRAWFRRIDESRASGARTRGTRSRTRPGRRRPRADRAAGARAACRERRRPAAPASARATSAPRRSPRRSRVCALRALPEIAPMRKPASRVSATRSPVEIEGVGDLPTTMARCCAPVPPEPIAGYVTLGRGVTIHRARCANLLRMQALNPKRVLRVEWNSESDSSAAGKDPRRGVRPPRAAARRVGCDGTENASASTVSIPTPTRTIGSPPS